MKKRKRSKGQILTATALKVTPLLLVAVLGTKFAYDTVMDDYKGILGLNDLKNEVVSTSSANYSDPSIQLGNGVSISFEQPDFIPVATPEPVYVEEKVIPEYSREMLDQGYQFLDVDWGTLKSYNEDIVGYIVLDGTQICYPVVQSKDNEVQYFDINGGVVEVLQDKVLVLAE